jgi:hypothetical protein
MRPYTGEKYPFAELVAETQAMLPLGWRAEPILDDEMVAFICPLCATGQLKGDSS